MRNLLLVGIGWALASGVNAQPQLEMWQEPSHQLALHRGQTRIINVLIEPEVMTEYHLRRLPTLFIVVQDARALLQRGDDHPIEPASATHLQPGTLIDRTKFLAEPGNYRVINADERSQHLIAIINEAEPTSPSITPSDNDLLNNPFFMEQRLRLGPNELSTTLQLEHDAVLVQYDEGKSHIWEAGERHSFKTGAGEFSWHPAGSEIRVANGEPTPREFVLILVKK
jgi:hypothetical protein